MEPLRNRKFPDPQGCTANLRAVGDALYAIGGKWKLRIIVALTTGNKRFNELQRVVEGISARVLSNELKELELNGFIERRVDTGYPVVVEYALTAYAETLGDVLHALAEWGHMHGQKVRKKVVCPEELEAAAFGSSQKALPTPVIGQHASQ
ncbi:MAG: helix-turn-helix domain-containing protein [Candidatus Pseudobacter hemicellulosilyticus]|uniref:Helix-turn-helix domain-containing protein n=1 Tax=Candidatus Pseudobacter hemicellulosilyticus TaxID=3121375 RepID=A0AAJ5WPY0_9BACT|nr:MAG: helix-turn-helix domain-containing protein [Pseudobacter sp.]